MGSSHQVIFWWNQQHLFHWQYIGKYMYCPSSTNLDNNRLGLSIGWISSTNMHGIYIACNYVGQMLFAIIKISCWKGLQCTSLEREAFLWWDLPMTSEFVNIIHKLWGSIANPCTERWKVLPPQYYVLVRKDSPQIKNTNLHNNASMCLFSANITTWWGIPWIKYTEIVKIRQSGCLNLTCV